MASITSKTRLTDAEIKGLGVARTLQRRFRARHLYRVRRDRKIAVDFIGREYSYGQHRMRLRLTSYDPRNSMVKFSVIYPRGGGWVVWYTDQFWSHLRYDKLREV